MSLYEVKFSSPLSFTDATVGVTIVKNPIAEVIGPETIIDPEFDTACGVNWTCNGDAAISGGTVTYSSDNLTNFLQSQPTGTIIGDELEVNITILQNSSAGVSLFMGGNDGIGVFTGTGSFTNRITLVNAASDIVFVAAADGSLDTIEISFLSVKKVTPASVEETATINSQNKLSLSEILQYDLTWPTPVIPFDKIYYNYDGNGNLFSPALTDFTDGFNGPAGAILILGDLPEKGGVWEGTANVLIAPSGTEIVGTNNFDKVNNVSAKLVENLVIGIRLSSATNIDNTTVIQVRNLVRDTAVTTNFVEVQYRHFSSGVTDILVRNRPGASNIPVSSLTLNSPAPDISIENDIIIQNFADGSMTVTVLGQTLTVTAAEFTSNGGIVPNSNIFTIDFNIQAAATFFTHVYTGSGDVPEQQLLLTNCLDTDLQSVMESSISKLIDGLTPGDATQRFYDTHNQNFVTPNATKNPNRFVSNIDLRPYSMIVETRTEDQNGCSLVHPRFALGAFHLAGAYVAGNIIQFEVSDGTYEGVTVLSDMVQIGTSDLGLVHLSNGISQVPFFEIMPADWRDYFTNQASNPIPFIRRNRKNQTLSNVAIHGIKSSLTLGADLDFTLPPTEFQPWVTAIASGDSGSACAFLIGTKAVFIGSHYTFTSTPCPSDYIPEIEAAMLLLSGSADKLTIANLSAFNKK